MSQNDDAAVILPLGGTDATDPWELLARGDAAVLTADPSPGTGTPWGPSARAGSALGRGLAQAVSDLPQAVSSATGQRFLLRMPPGQGQSELMSAVGGGFRAITSGPSGKIGGHATLIPMSPKAALGAIGPVGLGLLALTVVSEMVGGDEQAAALAAIDKGVSRLNARLDLDDDAKLRTAEQTIRQAHAALLDGAAIPESIGLGSAMTDLQVIRNRSESLLTGWEGVVSTLSGEASGVELREGLGSVGRIGWEGFPTAVRTAYRAIALDSRRIMLTAAEAQLRNPGSPLGALREAVAADLDARTRELGRMRELFQRLATTRLNVSSWSAGVLPHLVSGSASENSDTQALFAEFAAALAPRTEPSTDSVESMTVDSRPDGSLQLVRAM